MLQDEYRDRLAVVRSADLFPKEPIIRVHYPSGKVETIFERAEDIYNRTLWTVANAILPRQHPLIAEGSDAESGESKRSPALTD
jgi:hypothetical protein